MVFPEGSRRPFDGFIRASIVVRGRVGMDRQKCSTFAFV